MRGLYDYTSPTSDPYDATGGSVQRANAYMDARRRANDDFTDQEHQIALRDATNAPSVRRYEFDQGMDFKRNALAQLLGRPMPDFFGVGGAMPFSVAQIGANVPTASGASYGGSGGMMSPAVNAAANNFILRLLQR